LKDMMGDPEEISRYFDSEKRNWWFSSKRKIVGRYLKKSQRRGLLLDVACGIGTNTSEFRSYTSCIGCDISLEYVRFCARDGDPFVCSNAEYLPFKPGVFSVVLSLDTLEHLDDDRRAVEEICRVLADDGVLILNVPALKILWSRHDVLLKHKRRYSRSEILDIVEPYFIVEKLVYWNFLLFPILLPMRVIGRLVDKLKGNLRKDSKYIDPLWDDKTPELVNLMLKTILRAEIFLLDYLKPPFGSSLFCVARKRQKDKKPNR